MSAINTWILVNAKVVGQEANFYGRHFLEAWVSTNDLRFETLRVTISAASTLSTLAGAVV